MKDHLLLKCSPHALAAASRIAPNFGFAVDEVAELIDLVAEGRFTEARIVEVTKKRAAAVREVLIDLLPVIDRVHKLDCSEGYLDHHPAHLSVTVLAVALMNGSNTQHLARFGDTLQKLAYIAGNLSARQDETDPREALILAKMVTATNYWFKFDEPARFGAFVATPEGFRAEEGTGLQFVTEVVLAANDGLVINDLRPSFEIMRASMDLEPEDQKGKDVPFTPRLRLVE